MKKGRHFTVSLIDGLWLFHRKVYYIISIIIYFIAKSAYAPVPCSAISNPSISSLSVTLKPTVDLTKRVIAMVLITQNTPTIPTLANCTMN